MTQRVSESAPPSRTTVPLVRLLRAELRWVFRRPRTLIVLGLIAALPIAIGVGLTLVDSSGPGPNSDREGAALLAAAAGNAFVLPIAALTFSMGLLLPLAAAMAGGDAIAGELSHGTLRGWMLAPVSRGRLLVVKAFGVAVVTLTAVAALATTGVLTGLVINGTDALFTLSGTSLSLLDTLGRVAVAVGWVSLHVWAIGAVALAISACTEHPMLVVASVLGGTVVFSVLGLLEALSWLHPFLLTESYPALADILRDPIPGAELSEGALRAACYVVIGLSLAYARITTRDG
ncbi:ABC transporter permease [Amycolatopsis palatopharyngis]|uniref:ABC transporter permease n=1 Tax=Amycolatopsis palatopharyngis TaxID=187982 RepID=UPI000E288CBD|nr:ABC transporter permease subunit [Amycolatopsis palatopharyngis]